MLEIVNVCDIDYKGGAGMTPVTVTEKGRKAFGKRLSDYREKMGVSLEVAAEMIRKGSGKAKFAKSTLNDIENAATKQVTLDTLFALCQAGYGGMSFNEMADILSDRRLAACEESATYNVDKKAIAV